MRASHIAKGGLFVALTVIFLYLAGILPTNKLAFITLASAIIPVTLMATSISTSLLVYVASSIIALLLVNTSIALAYIIFFGSYGLVKFYIEKLKNLMLEYFLKLLFFNFCFYIIYKLYSLLLFKDILKNLPLWSFILAGELAFLLFDYALSVIITYYLKRFHKEDL